VTPPGSVGEPIPVVAAVCCEPVLCFAHAQDRPGRSTIMCHRVWLPCMWHCVRVAAVAKVMPIRLSPTLVYQYLRSMPEPHETACLPPLATHPSSGCIGGWIDGRSRASSIEDEPWWSIQLHAWRSTAAMRRWRWQLWKAACPPQASENKRHSEIELTDRCGREPQASHANACGMWAFSRSEIRRRTTGAAISTGIQQSLGRQDIWAPHNSQVACLPGGRRAGSTRARPP
jgi:hypothetical protein